MFLHLKSLCTDDYDSISYLNRWDVKIPNLDVTDDYLTEKDQIQRVQGKDFSFSFGDYICKSMLGSIYHKLDQLDETKYRKKKHISIFH